MKPLRVGSLRIPPITAATLATLVVSFFVAGLAANFVPGAADVLSYFPVRSDDVIRGQVWRLFTYALLHDLADPFHLVINGFVIFMFGRELEERWGAARFGVFTVLTIVMGGVFVVLGGLLPSGRGLAIGASALTEGLIVAWGLTYRDRPLRLFFALEVRGIHMVWIAVFLWLLQAVSTSSVSASAHLGGMVTAAMLVLVVWRPNAAKVAWWSLLERLGLKKTPTLYVVPKPRSKDDDKKWVN
jgi:membrane associated rhomboid family serine protease